VLRWWYREALDVDESAVSARGAGGQGDFHLAWILESRGEYVEAARLYRELAELDDDNAGAAAGLARMLERRGETEEARVWREHAEGHAHLDGPSWPT